MLLKKWVNIWIYINIHVMHTTPRLIEQYEAPHMDKLVITSGIQGRWPRSVSHRQEAGLPRAGRTSLGSYLGMLRHVLGPDPVVTCWWGTLYPAQYITSPPFSIIRHVTRQLFQSSVIQSLRGPPYFNRLGTAPENLEKFTQCMFDVQRRRRYIKQTLSHVCCNTHC